MNTSTLHPGDGSSVGTDLTDFGSDQVECVKAGLVEAWIGFRRDSVRLRQAASPDTPMESYDIDPDAWLRFDILLDDRCLSPGAGGTSGGDLSVDRRIKAAAASPLARACPADMDKADRPRRYMELARLLDEWESEPGEFDAQVAPLIEQAIRETAPRHHRD